MYERLFLLHPRSMGESYLEHQKTAFGFAGALFVAACACALHGVAPGLCETTGSTLVKRLYERMVSQRRKPSAATASAPQTAPWADYAI